MAASETAKRSAWRIAALASLALFAVLLTVLLASSGWLLGSAAGLAWAVESIERASGSRLRVVGASGRLVGPLAVERVDFTAADAQYRVDDVRLDWRPLALLGLRLHVDALTATRVERRANRADDDEPARPPGNLVLPLALQVDRLQVDALYLFDAGTSDAAAPAADPDGALPTIHALHAAFASDGRQHRLHEFSLTIAAGTLTGTGTMDGGAPHELAAEVRFNGDDPPLSASARARGPLAELVVDFSVRLRSTADAGPAPPQTASLTSPSAEAVTPMSLTGQATLRPFAVQPLAALRVVAEGVDPQTLAGGAPHARLALDVELAGADDGSFAGRLRVDNAAPATLDRGGLPFASIESRLLLHPFSEPRRLRLDALRLAVRAAGPTPGNISGRVELQWPTSAAATPALLQIDADLEVAQLDPSTLHSALQRMSLAGRATLAGDASVQEAVLYLGDGTRQLAARLTRRDEQLTLSALRLAQGDAELAGSGEFSLDAPQAWRFAGRLRNFDPNAFLAPGHGVDLSRSRLNASFSADGRLKPQLAGRLRFAITDSRLAGEALAASGDLRFSGLNRPGELLAGDGRAWLRGRFDLSLGASRLHAEGGWGAAGERLDFSLSAPQLARHRRLLPELDGAVDVRGHVAGFPAHPELALVARASGLSLPGGVRFGALEFDAELRAAELRDVAPKEATLTATLVARAVAVGEDEVLASLRASLSGALDAHRASVAAQLADGGELAADLHGKLHAPAVASGNWQHVAWHGSVEALSLSGNLPFSLRRPAALAVERSDVGVYATLRDAELAFAGGSVVLVDSRWRAGRWSTQGYFKGLGLRPGDLPAGETLRFGGAWTLAGSLLGGEGEAGGAKEGALVAETGSLERLMASLDGTFELRRESGDWLLPGILPIELRRAGLSAADFSARLAGGRAQLDLRVAGSRIGRWRAEASVPLGGDDGFVSRLEPLDGWVQAAVDDLQWLAPAINGNLTSGGTLALDARVSGTPEAPIVEGYLRGNALAFGVIDENVLLKDGELRVRFDRQRASVEQLTFAVPHSPPARAARTVGFALPAAPGGISVRGDFDFAEQRGGLVASLSRVPLTQRPERWLVASGSARLDYREAALRATAELVADAGFIAEAGGGGRPTLADDIVVLGRDEESRRATRIDTDLAIDLGERFHLRAAGLTARLVGRLRVRGEQGDARLTATGSIAARDATFDAYGQRLVVERGIVNFQGPLDDPGLNVLALRKGGEVEAGVAITGTVQRPVVRLVSTPNVPDAEKLSWIVLGRPPDAGGVDASMLLNAAGSILGGDGEGVSGQITQRLGIDELSLRPEDSQEPLAGQVLVVGKRLSARTHLGYEQGLTAATRAIRLTHALTPRISLVTRAGDDSAIDVFYSLSFD